MSKNATVSITLKLKGNAGADLSRISVEQIKHTQKITAGWNMAAIGQAKFTDQMRRSTTETKQAAGASDQLLRTNRMLEGVLRQQAIQTRLLSQQLKAQTRDYTLQTRMLSEQARHARELQRALADAARSQRDMSRNQPKNGNAAGGMGGLVGGIAGGAAAAYAMVRNPLERARSFETKIFDATTAITGGYVGMSSPQVQSSNLQLNTYAKEAVRKGHGSVEGVADSAEILAASGLYQSVEELKIPLLAIAKTAFANGAAETDIALLTQQIRQFGIKPEDTQRALDRASTSGYLGGFELKDMARLLPEVLPYAKAAGYSGQQGMDQVTTHMQLARKYAGLPSQAADNARDFYNLVNQHHFSLAMGKFIKPEEGDPIKKIGLRGNRKGFDINTYLANKREDGVDVTLAITQLIQRQLSKNPRYVALQSELQTAEKNGDTSAATELKKSVSNLVAGGEIGKIFHNQQSLSFLMAQIDGLQKGEYDRIHSGTERGDGAVDRVKAEKSSIEPAQAHALEQESILTTIKMYDTVKERLGNFEQGLADTMKANQTLAASAYAAAAALGIFAAAKVGGAMMGGGAAAAGGAAAGAAAGGLGAAVRSSVAAAVVAGGASVLAAGAVGYGAGTLINKGFVEGTEGGHNLGGTIATIMANLPDWMGGDTARAALDAEMAGLTQEGNRKLDELIQLQRAQLEQQSGTRPLNLPVPTLSIDGRGLMLSMADAVNQESRRGVR